MRRLQGRRGLWVAATAVALVLAAVVSFYASGSPDGLERVAADEGFLETARDHDLADGPLADYGVEGVDDERLSGGLAGVVGVVVTLVIGVVLFRLVRRPGGGDDGDDGDAERSRAPAGPATDGRATDEGPSAGPASDGPVPERPTRGRAPAGRPH